MKELTYLQKIRIVQQELDCCENTYLLDILNDDDIWEEIKQHPHWIKADAESNPYIYKDLMNEAEWDVKAKWAFSIYNAVKDILDKGGELT